MRFGFGVGIEIEIEIGREMNLSVASGQKTTDPDLSYFELFNRFTNTPGQ